MEFKAPNTLAEQIANYLAQQIMTGQIQPGDRIHEARVAATLEVSRASVKEALYILERWHLVDITPRKGATASQLDAKHATELYDVYMHLLLMLAERLVDLWQEEDLKGLLPRIDRVVQLLNAHSDVLDVVEAVFDVMQAACSVVDNPYLTEALINFKPAVSRTYYLSSERYQRDLDRTADFFSNLTKAVLDRDKAKVQELVIRFGEDQKQLIIQALSAQPAMVE